MESEIKTVVDGEASESDEEEEEQVVEKVLKTWQTWVPKMNMYFNSYDVCIQSEVFWIQGTRIVWLFFLFVHL